jgi:hypothetical protein
LVRFGHSNNFTSLFQGDEDREDYILGLIFVGCLIMSLFLAWAVLLIVLKCSFREHNVGFLSGSAYRADPPEEQNKEILQEPGGDIVREAPVDGVVNESKRKWPDRPMRGRIVFLLSGVIYIIFSALLVTKGITNLQSSVNTLNVSAQQIRLISAEAADIIQEGLTDLEGLAGAIRTQISDQFAGQAFCPADPTLENSVLGLDVSGQADEALLLLDRLDNFTSDDLASLKDGVLSVSSRSMDVIDYTEDIDLNDWESLLILIPYIVVPSVLLSACVMAFFDVEYHPLLLHAIHWFFMPLFIIMNVVAFLTAGLMIIGAGANADFCLPGGQPDASPDQTILQILELEGYGPESKVFAIFQYYIQKCIEGIEDPFLFLRQYMADVVEIDGGLGQLKTVIDGDGVLEELSLYCNREFAPLDALVTQMLGILAILREAGERTLDLASCDRIVPIYTNTFYTGSCDYSLKAMMWIFACALIIGTSGMLMVTFRAAYKLTVVEDPSASEDGVDTNMNTTAQFAGGRNSTDDDYYDDYYSDGDRPGELRIREVQAPTESADWVDDDDYSDYGYRDQKVEVPLQVD